MIRYECFGESFDSYEEALQCATENAGMDMYCDGLRDYVDRYGFIRLLNRLPDEVLCHIYDYVDSECGFYVNEIEEPDESEEE